MNGILSDYGTIYLSALLLSNGWWPVDGSIKTFSLILGKKIYFIDFSSETNSFFTIIIIIQYSEINYTYVLYNFPLNRCCLFLS